jgi:uncharacterized protein with ParB-like and HNH nuclease domain
MNAHDIQTQIDTNRRTVAFDNYDITVQQIFQMIQGGSIEISPEYQRHFAWGPDRQSQLVESLFLGIPVPSLFFATNADSTWEVVDGLQRLTTLVNFVGSDDDIEKLTKNCKRLTLCDLDKLDSLNGVQFSELPKSMQLMFLTRPLRITVLNDRSDYKVRYDLFERLNTGGITLHPQEIRNCIYLGDFNDFIKDCAKSNSFNRVVKTTEVAKRVGNKEELVLKFFAYYEKRNDFTHSVKGFLNDYMASKTKHFKNKRDLTDLFNETFSILDSNLPQGIVRGNRVNITPLVLYEAISVGLADAIQTGKKVHAKRLPSLLQNQELTSLTTGATNSRTKLAQRIQLVSQELTR